MLVLAKFKSGTDGRIFKKEKSRDASPTTSLSSRISYWLAGLFHVVAAVLSFIYIALLKKLGVYCLLSGE